MAKRKVSRKFKAKAIMERQMQERKPPSQPRKKFDFKQFIKTLPSRIAKFTRDVIHELKKVTWPTRKALINYTIVVIATIVFFAILLGVFDLGFIRVIELLANI
jgi:preprotein translocase subunit SecE